MTATFRRSAIYRLLCFSLVLAGSTATANVSALMFQDNMVLQRRMAVPVFGSAAVNEDVSVSFRGQNKSAKAGANGKWKVILDATEAGGPFEMILKGANTLTLKNVMVGEVWLCGGQSNMEWTMNSIGGVNKDSAMLANFPNIRVITMQFGRDRWAALTPEVALNFSASAYYFGKDLHNSLNVPIGLISSSVGGTAVERWLDPATLAADPVLSKDTTAGDLYRNWIAPVQPYGIRGAIWYQGESNANATAPFYRSRFGALITGWRKVWNQGDFPFYFVQIANHMALPARHLAYGRLQDSAYTGPTFDTCEKKGSMVRVHFKHAHGGLVDKASGTTKGFALAGADNKWYWAAMVIRKDTVILSTTNVPSPLKVRYAWANNPAGVSLFNGAGLPASPFQANVPKEVPTAIKITGRAMKSGVQMAGPATADALGRRPDSDLRHSGLPRFLIHP